MSREFLQNIIDNFELQRLKRFFSEKNSKFRPSEENFGFHNTNHFSDGLKLGELSLEDGTLLVCAFDVKQELSERSGKKAQYELGKKILKDTQSDAGIFIYHNQAGSFRFSLIYANYLGKKRDWSAFRRFTYFVSKDFTNKTFLQRIGDGDFSSLEKIKDAFSVEKVTKEFYEDIANWYFWAVENSTFPNDNEEENGRNISVIRLITRMIFIWFMRERGLVPKDLFEEKNITSIIKSISAQDSTYYTAILQNLFFATLSTKKNERKFRSEIRGYKGYNPDFGNQNVFRFQELFKNPGKLKDYFGEIPFLNGGLFECLDDKPNGIYIDGFTAVKKNQPTVPNFLFFSQEQKADLNKAYGTKSKTYKVRGLLDILSSFNFTIDENSPDDSDIALDPELLGRVFENLLASFNPETSTTARKATGSYYTPREIVDYMVTESLKAYFKTHLTAISDLDKKIDQLFSIASEENPFDKSESKQLVELIESVKIVDPAVGSGAFPMGALNKLVFILSKIDPGNELWKQAQLLAADTIPDPRIKQDTKNRIEEFFKGKNADYGRKLYLIQKCIYGVDIQQIAVEIAKLRFFISLLVDEGIDKTKENWGIEPLPNLDFKIMQGDSLLEEYEGVKLFDEKLLSQTSKQEIIDKISEIDLKLKENDIHRLKFYEKNPQWMKNKKIEKPSELLILENNKKVLDTKKVTLANELKSFESTCQQGDLGLYEQSRAKSLGDELKRLHKEFFETNEKETKDKIKKQIEKIGWDLIEATLKEQSKTSELKKLEQFKKSNTKPFFLWKLHFADVFENGGFDIVIANPPWISNDNISEKEKNIFKSLFTVAKSRFDLANLFVEKSLNLLKINGWMFFVMPEHTWIGDYFIPFRKYLSQNSKVTEIISSKQTSFEEVSNPSSMFLAQNSPPDNGLIEIGTFYEGNKPIKFKASIMIENRIIFNDFVQKLSSKIHNLGFLTLDQIALVTDGVQTANLLKVIFTEKPDNNKDCFKALRGGKEIKFRYSPIEWGGWWVLKPEHTRHLKRPGFSYDSPKRMKCFLAKEKIILRQTEPTIFATIDSSNYYYPNSIFQIALEKDDPKKLRWLLGLLNGRFLRFLYGKLAQVEGTTMPQMYLNILKSLPVPSGFMNEISNFVDKILAITKSDDYLENIAKQAQVKEYENQIDQLVYKLYDLTPEEIKIVEGYNKS